MSVNQLVKYRGHLWKHFRVYSSAAADSRTGLKLGKEKRPPFLKNAILGRFDSKLLEFPEALSNENLKSLELKYLALESESKNLTVEKLGAAIVPERQFTSENLAPLATSEMTKLAEAVSSPSLSLVLDISQNLIPSIIENYGTDEMKEKYVSKLRKGQLVATYASCEEKTGSDLPSLESYAFNSGDSSWTLKGSKTWVTNADKSDVILVFCKNKLDENSLDRYELSAFLVDRNTPGVIIEKQITSTLSDVNIFNVNFNVQLDTNCLIADGYEIGKQFLGSLRFFLATGFSHYMKFFISEAVRFIKPRKQLLCDLKDTELILNRLGSAALNVYALDSMLYLLSGMRDNYDMDTCLEAAAIHNFCVKYGMESIDQCMDVLGSRAFDLSLPYHQLRLDLSAAISSVYSKDVNDLYLGLTALQYAAEDMAGLVKKMRNSFQYPRDFFKSLLQDMRNSRDSPKLNLHLYENLHPSLKGSADELEYLVLRIHYATKMFLTRHGQDVVNRQIDIMRLSSVLIDIFAMTAVAGRASRSYCTGMLNADEEVAWAVSFGRSAILRSKLALQEVIDGAIDSNDITRINVGRDIIKHGGYFVQHPLVKNIF